MKSMSEKEIRKFLDEWTWGTLIAIGVTGPTRLSFPTQWLLYINNDRGGYTPEGNTEKNKLSDYQKKKPPVNKRATQNTNPSITGGSYEDRRYQT